VCGASACSVTIDRARGQAICEELVRSGHKNASHKPGQSTESILYRADPKWVPRSNRLTGPSPTRVQNRGRHAS
jgi:hypothetical protein